MPSFQINLYLETSDHPTWAPEGPGWYLDARRNVVDNPPGVEVSGRVRLTPGEAEQIAQVLDRFKAGRATNWSLPEDRRENLSLHEGVKQANGNAVAELSKLLAEIERQAQSIPALRGRLGEFSSGS